MDHHVVVSLTRKSWIFLMMILPKNDLARLILIILFLVVELCRNYKDQPSL